MSLFGRYLFRQAAGAFLMIMLSLTGIVWTALALKQLSVLTSKGQDVLIFLKMTLLALPSLMALIAPIALLIATLHTLNRLNHDSELIVMTASGAPVWRFQRPLMVLAALVCVALLLANVLFLPWSARALQAYVIKVKTDLISQLLQPGEFSTPEKGLTFHIRARDANGDLRGLVMNDDREPGQSTSYLADRGELLKQDEQAYLVMQQGHILRRTDKAKPAAILKFDRYIVDLTQNGPKAEAEGIRPRTRSTWQLMNPDPADSAYARNPGAFRAELHDRFATALYPAAFVLIAVAFLGQARTNRQGRTKAVIGAFLTATVLRVAGIAASNLAAGSAAAVALVYALPIGGILLAPLLAARLMRPARGGWRSRRPHARRNAPAGAPA